MEVLDRAVIAHGGAELLDRSVDLRFSLTGTLRYQGHYPRPWAHRDSRIEGTTVDSAARDALKSTRTYTQEGESSPAFTIVGPRNGLQLELWGDRPEPIMAHRDVAHRLVMQTWFLREAEHRVPYSVLEEKMRLAEAQPANPPP